MTLHEQLPWVHAAADKAADPEALGRDHTVCPWGYLVLFCFPRSGVVWEGVRGCASGDVTGGGELCRMREELQSWKGSIGAFGVSQISQACCTPHA